MKARESGMPAEDYWQTFFDTDATLDRLIPGTRINGDLVEFGCGYGTFTLPAARRTDGRLTALDIEPAMVACVREKAVAHGVTNLEAVLRDFVTEGTGLATASQAHAMVFNLLHLEDPVGLLREAHRVLMPGGLVSVIHWRSDVPKPRGPSLEIRPLPSQCAGWLETAGFRGIRPVELSGACPYHFGLLAER